MMELLFHVKQSLAVCFSHVRRRGQIQEICGRSLCYAPVPRENSDEVKLLESLAKCGSRSRFGSRQAKKPLLFAC
jgi:hypothetical protein